MLFTDHRVFALQVYDISFSRAGGGRDMFASVGADGSVRMFDLRHLEHSTIIYEDPQHHPLLRLCWNKQDPNYLVTMAMDSMEVSAATSVKTCYKTYIFEHLYNI